MIQLLLIKSTPPFQLLPMPKVDLSYLRIHEAPPLQLAQSQVIHFDRLRICPCRIFALKTHVIRISFPKRISNAELNLAIDTR